MIVVSGYYGFANLGDEAILAALCADLEVLGFSRREILVLSHNPADTESVHGVRAIDRYNLRKVWQILGIARGFVSGGGSLLQDVTGPRSIPYYLGLAELALLRKIPVVMYGQGIGPVQSALFRRWVRRVYGRSSAYSVRDRHSADFLAAGDTMPAKGWLAADAVFGRELKRQDTAGVKKIVLNLRPYSGWQAQRRLWIELISRWQDGGFEIEFAALGPGDEMLGFELREQLPALNINSAVTLQNVEAVFKGVRLCISMRLHGMIFAALHDVLPIGLKYDPKVAAIGAQLQVPCWDPADLSSLTAGMEGALRDYEYHRSIYHKNLAELRQKALGNRAALARGLLGE